MINLTLLDSVCGEGKHQLWTHIKRKRPDDPSRAFLRGARWIGSPILLAPLMLCAAIVARAQPTDRAPDTIEARLRACTPCHGSQGQGTNNDYFPRLAGKPAGYLMNQLIAFRDGRRRYPPMNYLLEYQSEPYLQKIAEYFAALRPSPVQNVATDVSAVVLARGRSLVTEGDPARGVPACSGCHGPKLTGMEPAIPGLVGLRELYQRAARRLSLRHADGRRTRLHAACCGQPDRKRRHRCRCMARRGADPA